MDSATKIVSLVQIAAKGAPEVLVSAAVRAVFAEICRRTDCWRLKLSGEVGEVEETVDGKIRVLLPTTGHDAEISRVFGVWVERKQGELGELEQAARITDGTYGIVRSGTGAALEFANKNQVSAGDKLTVDVSLVPLEIGTALTDIPPAIVELCGPAAYHLASAKIMRMSRRPWTDYEAAQWEYVSGMNAIREILFKSENGSTDLPAMRRMEGLVEG